MGIIISYREREMSNSVYAPAGRCLIKKCPPTVLFHPEPEEKAFSFHYKNQQVSEAMPAGFYGKITKYPDHHRKVLLQTVPLYQ